MPRITSEAMRQESKSHFASHFPSRAQDVSPHANLSHNSLLTRWWSSRRRVDLITATIHLRRLLQLHRASLLPPIVALVRSHIALILTVESFVLSVSWILLSLSTVLWLLLLWVLILRVVRGGPVSGRGITHPSGAVEWRQPPLATTTR